MARRVTFWVRTAIVSMAMAQFYLWAYSAHRDESYYRMVLRYHDISIFCATRLSFYTGNNISK